MRGKYRVVIQNKKIKYDFEIRRNITIIRGDSATGKTALVDMVREYYQNGEDSGIELHCSKTCIVLEGRNWKTQLSMMKDSIVFIDEGNNFVSSKDFSSEIQDTDNYYVLVTRESLSALPYSVNEIYGIRNSGKYGYLKQTYNELYRIYGFHTVGEEVKPEQILTEDSNSGFQFFEAVGAKNSIRCISANGKSNIFRKLLDQGNEKVLVVADSAAFGSEIEKVMNVLKVKNNIALYLPESFEWIILQSGILKDSELDSILEAPFDFIESKEYFSWERYFTDLLIKKTGDSYLKYTKQVLNPAYLQENILGKILKVMEKVDFRWNIS